MKVAVVGHGMAGARIARELGRRGTDVVVFGAESHGAYNRVLLSGLLAGRHAESDIALPVPPANVELRLGEPVEAVDLDVKRVNGVGFDKLVLACGAEAVVPPIAGLDPLPPKAHVFRTLGDAREVVKGSEGCDSAIVLGGGLLGLEAARGLAGRGLDVVVVHAAGHLMERQLDPGCAGVLAETYAELGVRTIVDATTMRVISDGGGLRLELADGRTARGELLVVSCGVRPNTALAKAAGLRARRGIVVDDACRTSHPDVFAVGDCAEHDGIVHGLVGPAWEQADVVVDVLSGADPEARYTGSRLVTRLKASGVDLAAMGRLDGPEVVTFSDPSRGTCARLVIDGDRLAGAVMVGDNPTVGRVVQLYDAGDPVPRDRRSLLMGRFEDAEAGSAVSSESVADDAVVCRCNDVTKRRLAEAHAAGAR
ncbi:MAG: NAD(P)/FAD-dependent oxidoreductase, partial [Stackebrandtia sp.]